MYSQRTGCYNFFLSGFHTYHTSFPYFAVEALPSFVKLLPLPTYRGLGITQIEIQNRREGIDYEFRATLTPEQQIEYDIFIKQRRQRREPTRPEDEDYGTWVQKLSPEERRIHENLLEQKRHELAAASGSPEQEETTRTAESDPILRTTTPDPQESEDIIESEEFEESEMTEPGNVTGGGGTQSGTGPTGTAPAPPGDRQPGNTGGTGPRDRETDSPDSARIRSSILPGGKEAKVKPPPTFTGDRDAAEGFLKAVKLNLRMNKQMYNTDERKILYTLSHMEGGTAETWKNNALDDIFDEEKDDEEITFETFEKRFRERFEPFDKVATAQRKLETLRMKETKGEPDT
ncbi:hypothetical protein MPER_06820, partial [Moniliophthora perniciosa FA553]